MHFGLDNARNAKRRKREEASLQEVLVRDLKLLLLPGSFVFSVPNEGMGRRDPAEVGALLRRGMVPGMPDLIVITRGVAVGLELKSKNGTLSAAQRQTIPMLRAAGMRVETARTHAEAIQVLRSMGVPMRLKEAA